MPIPITCLTCAAKFNAPDAAVGKRGKCPKCQAPFVVPNPNAADGFEVMEDAPIIPEIVDDTPTVVATKSATTGTAKTKKPNPRNKKQIDETDYLTKVNGNRLRCAQAKLRRQGFHEIEAGELAAILSICPLLPTFG